MAAMPQRTLRCHVAIWGMQWCKRSRSAPCTCLQWGAAMPRTSVSTSIGASANATLASMVLSHCAATGAEAAQCSTESSRLHNAVKLLLGVLLPDAADRASRHSLQSCQAVSMCLTVICMALRRSAVPRICYGQLQRGSADCLCRKQAEMTVYAYLLRTPVRSSPHACATSACNRLSRLAAEVSLVAAELPACCRKGVSCLSAPASSALCCSS